MLGFQFQIVIYHPVATNNCSNFVPPALLLDTDNPGLARQEKQPYIMSLDKIN